MSDWPAAMGDQMPPQLLTDDEMSRFIRDGFVTVMSTLDRAFHDDVWSETDRAFTEDGNPGNNLIPRFPHIQRVLDDAPVQGALISLLGPDYYAQPHRHPHANPPGSPGQQMHQDGGRRWSHRTRRLLVFYYPQDTPEEIGPTGVVPGSHFYSTQDGAALEAELPVVGQAGAVTLANYDLWHRAMPNLGNRTRYMLKFLYARMSEPSQPTWDAADPVGGAPAHGMEARSLAWHYGAPSDDHASAGQGQADLLARLDGSDEGDALQAAYSLSDLGPAVVDALATTLVGDSENAARNASHALTAIGAPAVGAVADALDHERPEVRARAAETLGDMGMAAAESVPRLVDAARDGDASARRYAVEALGTTAQGTAAATQTLAGALADDDERVRRNAVLSLARIGRDAEGAEPALVSALTDESRYVRADAAHALRRIGTPEANDTLLEFLTVARWCPDTSPRSTH
ncbi:hypothetical protein HN371_15965 [Candidatus Poribacteria bacterium]|nr:hypothetical protein [Candidatus Poribacteria bacterium]MBT5533845.1 hypothetical protein [Candidatus Poribacteria bacterium]MBT5713527.1 hypothetical protein [Candidatus Poribacteria bacterium]MBT7806217.1 hypothetical protein [Candidatus Poribacteria bacterium]